MPLDHLTNLSDRQTFIKDLETDLSLGKSLRLYRIEAIHLKAVNRKYGQKAGDRLLEVFAQRMRGWHPDFRAYRINPVTFVLISDGTEQPDAQELYDLLKEPVALNGETVIPKTRIICLNTEKGDSEHTVLDLFEYTAALREMLICPVIEIGGEIRSAMNRVQYVNDEVLYAMEHETFTMVYQPVYDLKKKKYISAEALIRLFGRDGKFISPGEFIPLAEKRYYIDRITDIVIKKVCSFLGRNPDLNIDSVSINLTPGQIMDEELPAKLEQIAEESGIALSKLRLEMTERTIQQSPSQIAGIMNRLNEMGTGFYLDDFGTGYSNLSSVIALPFEAIKFDRSLILSLGNEQNDRMIALLAEMMHIGHAKIIAEGVEEEWQVRYAEENGIDRIQGYYYSKPLNEEQFVQFVREHNGKD